MGNMPYNFVLALIEKEPVVLAAKPCFVVFVNEFVESFHTPSKDSSTQTDRRLIPIRSGMEFYLTVSPVLWLEAHPDPKASQ